MKYERYQLRVSLTYSIDSPRSTPFKKGFTPVFDFGMGLCGARINPLDREWVNKGETFDAILSFPHPQLLNNPKKGTIFSYCETPPNHIGEGEVLEVIGWVEE